MEAVIGTRAGQTAAATGRPGWWRLLVVLLGGALIAGGVLAGLELALPTPSGPLTTWGGGDVARISGPAATAAAAATSVVVLAALTLGMALVSRRWLDRTPVPSRLALAAVGLSSPALLAGGAGDDGRGTGVLVGLLVLRYGAFTADGAPRPGLLGTVAARRRGLIAGACVAVSVLCLLGAAAYGALHPVGAGAARWTTPARPVTALDEAARVVELPMLSTTGHDVTLLAVRGGAAASGVRVLAAGETPAGASDTGPHAAAPVLPMRLGGPNPVAWLGAARCPAAPVRVAAVEAKVRSWAGTGWVSVPMDPPIVLRCVPEA